MTDGVWDYVFAIQDDVITNISKGTGGHEKRVHLLVSARRPYQRKGPHYQSFDVFPLHPSGSMGQICTPVST